LISENIRDPKSFLGLSFGKFASSKMDNLRGGDSRKSLLHRGQRHRTVATRIAGVPKNWETSQKENLMCPKPQDQKVLRDHNFRSDDSGHPLSHPHGGSLLVEPSATSEMMMDLSVEAGRRRPSFLNRFWRTLLGAVHINSDVDAGSQQQESEYQIERDHSGFGRLSSTQIRKVDSRGA
jgi:hypothetical protein